VEVTAETGAVEEAVTFDDAQDAAIIEDGKKKALKRKGIKVIEKPDSRKKAKRSSES
jgi:hypothetical protein